MSKITPGKVGDWFEEYSPRLLLYNRQWLDAETASDVVQDVFMQLMKQKKEPPNVRAWLYRCCRNAVISKLRTRNRRRARESAIAETQDHWFEAHPSDLIDAGAVKEQLQKLEPDQREVIVLRIWGGLTFEDIAAVTESSKATVFRRHRDGLQAIREAMEKSCTKKI